MALLTVGLTACKEDIESAVPVQPTPQESILKADDVIFTPASITSIDLRDVKTNDAPISLGSVSVKAGAMSSGMSLKAVVQIAKAADFSDAELLEAEDMDDSYEIKILPSKLQSLYIDEFTLDPNPTTLFMRTNLYTVVGEESQASIGDPRTSFFGTYTVAFQPYDDGVRISNSYYAIVLDLDGNYQEIKCTHKETEDNPSTNVYDNPIFEVEIEALKDANNIRKETKYAFVAAEDLGEYKTDASVLFGDGENKTMVKGGSFFVGHDDDDAFKYIVTIDMKNLTIIAEPVIQFYCYYLYANTGANMAVENPETSRNYMFYKTDVTTFNYTTFWPNNNNGKSYFSVKIWEREAMLKNGTTKTWGFDGKATAPRQESGKFAQPGQWIGPVTEGWYTFTINMDDDKKIHTYQWTAIEAPTVEYSQISIIGTINGSNWDKDFDLTQCKKAPHNWYLLDFEITGNAELKFRANHNWDTKDWGGDGSQPISQVNYTLPIGTENINVPAGTYDLYLNDITGNWSILKK
jgi:hypothetical protein